MYKLRARFEFEIGRKEEDVSGRVVFCVRMWRMLGRGGKARVGGLGGKAWERFGGYECGEWDSVTSEGNDWWRRS